MVHRIATAICLVAVACASLASAAANCPPAGFDSVKDFNITQYVDGPWYIQEQMPNAYQPVNELFCVKALYVPEDRSNLNKGIQVINLARRGSVTGAAVGSTGSGARTSGTTRGRTGPSISLIAFPATELAADGSSSSGGPSAASKLAVGPSFLAPLYRMRKETFGPYWIVAVGKSSGGGSGYDWALVSGGPPKTSTDKGCVVGPLNPGPMDINNSGLWLFSRKPVDPTNTAIMREQAKKLGYDLSVLKRVEQEGCTYPSSSGGNSAGTTASGGNSAGTTASGGNSGSSNSGGSNGPSGNSSTSTSGNSSTSG